MSGSPRTAAGRALLDRVSPPVGDNVDPEEEWVAEAWAHRNEIEGAILAIEAEAATLGESRTLVERIGALPTFDVVTDTDGTGGRMVALDAVLAALAEVPVIPGELEDKT